MTTRPTHGTLLAYRALGLGDLLTAVPALRALATAFPGYRRLLAAPAQLAPLAMLAGVADEVVDVRAFDSLDGPLRRRGIRHVDVAVNLHGRGPQSHLVLRGLRPGRLLAFADRDGRRDEPGAPAWRDDEHEVRRWCRMLEAHGIATDPDDLHIEPPDLPLPAAAAVDGPGATVVHVGAASAARQWPPERFAAVARAELGAGRAVVFTGSEAERALAERVAAEAGAPPSSVLAGCTGLPELAAVVAAARAVVCGDTGIAHLATALRTPSVVLFGPTPPEHWGPPADRPWHVALWAGGVGDPHASTPDAGLLRIGVTDVLDALHGLVQPPGRERVDGVEPIDVDAPPVTASLAGGRR